MPSREDMAFREVDSERWTDLEALFEARGGPSYCWCMAWRPMPTSERQRGRQARKQALARQLEEGVPIGIIGYLEGEAAAWCSIAPRSSYRPLGGVDVPGEDPERVWSLACLYVRRDLRGQGHSRRLIDAAVRQARARGATAVEAYPVDPDSPSYRFMGFVEAFEAAGFHEVGRAGKRRHVLRLSVA